jgi:signal peptidase I
MKTDQWLQRMRVTAAEVSTPVAAFFRRKDVQAVIEWLKEPFYAVVIMFAFTTIVAQPFYVPSGSMEPTLAIGDAVFAAKFPYGYSRYSIPFMNGPIPSKRLFGSLPDVGDVVVFRLPRDISVTYVKRVIGLPGDRLQMRDGRLWINGRELPVREAGIDDDEDEYGNDVMTPKYIETLPNGKQHPIFKRSWGGGMMDNTDVYVVPPNHVFMMGDNRDNSLDSRVPPEAGGVGYVPIGNLVGRAFVVIGSVDFKKADGIWEWPFLFRFSRVLNHVH